MKVKNASQFPKKYYGLHFAEGVAQYNMNGKASRLLILEHAIKNMNPSFEGKPVYVDHVNDENLDKLAEEMDGVVVRSFFNKADGKYWVEFMVTTDEGHQRIREGWKLSNAYRVGASKGGGKWHNVDYDQEVTHGEFRHLAIVKAPRYEESVIYTPEEFKAYNERKEAELKLLENSMKERKPMFSLFRRKKEEVQNIADLADAFVEIDGKEVSLSEMIEGVKNAKKNEEEEKEKDKEKEKENKKMNMDSEIEVGDEKMSVKELVKKYQALNKKNAEPPKDKDKDKDEKDEKKDNKKKDNSTDSDKDSEGDKKPEDKKVDNSKDDKDAEKKRFEDLKNAHDNAPKPDRVVDLGVDKLARGKARYGT